MHNAAFFAVHSFKTHIKGVYMAAGWELKNGEILDFEATDEKYWSLFNFVFGSGAKKTNTYKFGLIKSLLDNLLNVEETPNGLYLSYHDIFKKFTENYWNLVIEFGIWQMKGGRSKIETILNSEFNKTLLPYTVVFTSLHKEQQKKIISKVSKSCRQYVMGALYSDFEGTLYSFRLTDEGIYFAPKAYQFLLQYKMDIEKLNYYAWAQFLEKINSEEKTTRLINKLEMAVPKRNNLSPYRELLRREFEVDTCFYCGKKLKSGDIHVDHFIPWSFIKEDKVWNFVLSCGNCNEKKNDKLPPPFLISKVILRNDKILLLKKTLVIEDFKSYSKDIIPKMWDYAKMGGLKIYENPVIA